MKKIDIVIYGTLGAIGTLLVNNVYFAPKKAVADVEPTAREIGYCNPDGLSAEDVGLQDEFEFVSFDSATGQTITTPTQRVDIPAHHSAVNIHAPKGMKIRVEFSKVLTPDVLNGTHFPTQDIWHEEIKFGECTPET